MLYRGADLCDTRNLNWPVEPDLFGMPSVRGVGQISNSTMLFRRLSIARPRRHVVLIRAPVCRADHRMIP